MEAYRIEDLAGESGTSVRTIRAYQDRGLLPKPERRGRANVYGPAHLARLRQVGDLLERGYTLASIKELLEAWDAGTGLGGVLGLLDEMNQPWSSERPVRIRRSVLIETFGGRNDEAIAEAVSLGVLEPVPGPERADSGAGSGSGNGSGVESDPGDDEEEAEGEEEDEEYLVPSPQELTVAAELHAAGVPLMAISNHLRELRGQVEHIAERFMEFTIEHVFGRFLDHTPSEAEATEAADLVRRLRPLAQQTVDVELARAMHTLVSGMAEARVSEAEAAQSPASPLAAALAAAQPEPAAEPGHLNVLIPATTLRAVRALVGPRQTAAFITAAAEREIQARTMDGLAANHNGDHPGDQRG
jgi:DNA-binding transcriptional MerR regulator